MSLTLWITQVSLIVTTSRYHLLVQSPQFKGEESKTSTAKFYIKVANLSLTQNPFGLSICPTITHYFYEVNEEPGFSEGSS